jgi:hypothetical protein
MCSSNFESRIYNTNENNDTDWFAAMLISYNTMEVG